MASGIVEVVRRRQLFILFPNFIKRPTQLTKEIFFGVDREFVVQLQVNELFDPASESAAKGGGANGAQCDENIESVNDMHYKSMKNRSTQMNLHEDFHECEDST